MFKTPSYQKIYWKLVPVERIEWETAYAIQTNYRRIPSPTTKLTQPNLYHAWFWQYNTICCLDEDGFAHRYSVVNEGDSNFTATEPHNLWLSFLATTKACEGASLPAKVGALNKSTYWIKHCVIAPLNYGLVGEFKCATKIDISSAYPYELSKRLPDWKNRRVVEGWVEPNEEYPFAYYSNGELCFLEEDGTYVATQLLRQSRWYGFAQQQRDKARLRHSPYQVPNLPTTILCKAVEGLQATANHYYELRHTDPNSKLAINLSIGFMHRNKCPLYAHVAAVVLARCANRMITMADQLTACGNKVTLIATDSVGWNNAQIDSCCFPPSWTNTPNQPTTTKSLGCAYLELPHCALLVRGPKAYQTYNYDTQTTTTKWSGKSTAETAAMPYGAIRQLTPQLTLMNTTNGTTYLMDANAAVWWG